LAFDRDTTLKKGEKFLRQGRLDAAIGEYSFVVEAYPRDWNTANLLGDLHFRAGQKAEALGQYRRIAEHLLREGFYPKAAALYKKIHKIDQDDEETQLVLADISAKQGLLADAKGYLHAVSSRRRERGDRDGVADIALRLGSLDPADFEARLEAARTLEEMGRPAEAAVRFRDVHDALQEQDRGAEALDALRNAVRLNPDDRGGRTLLARATVAAGDVLGARDYLDRDTAGDDPVLLAALVELDLRCGRIDPARNLMGELLASEHDMRARLIEIGWAVCESDPEAAYACVDAVTDSAIAAKNFAEAASHLEQFASHRPGHIPALLKLVEVCVDGGLETAMHEAQVRLADAYLDHGHAVEARVIAEDLVAREPWQREHIERFRKALVLLEVEDPDALIADRLSGQSPLMAADMLVDLSTDDPLSDLPADSPGEAPVAVLAGAFADAPPDVPARSVAATQDALEAPAVELAGIAAAVEESGVDPAARPFTRSSWRTAAVETAPPAGDIDLTGALGTLDGSGTAVDEVPETALEDVFGALHAEAEQEDAEFAAQYVKLAQTYVEMGMMDEAISSLKTAVRSPRHRFEAASQLGRLYLGAGNTREAIEWLERAAEEPAPDSQQGRALLYDLGVLLDDCREIPRALAVFLELQAEAGDYRDVPARIDRLARVQGGG
jgi:tetratricopeptide (TPR) repeat protein